MYVKEAAAREVHTGAGQLLRGDPGAFDDDGPTDRGAVGDTTGGKG